MTDREPRPLIAVAFVRPTSDDDARYLAAVSAAGGRPLPLLADATDWRADFERAWALLLTGGGDIGPAVYGPGSCPACRGIDQRRDRLELAVLQSANERQLPILGICRGMQFLNVAWPSSAPGSLVQDLPRVPVHHPARADHSSSYHSISLVAGSRLRTAVGEDGPFDVNSRHHQGLTGNELSAGLLATAFATDGVVEALEAPGERFVLGVQCHPERPGEAPELARVFAALVAAARGVRIAHS
jgi:putative glutamine amidotransferase